MEAWQRSNALTAWTGWTENMSNIKSCRSIAPDNRPSEIISEPGNVMTSMFKTRQWVTVYYSSCACLCVKRDTSVQGQCKLVRSKQQSTPHEGEWECMWIEDKDAYTQSMCMCTRTRTRTHTHTHTLHINTHRQIPRTLYYMHKHAHTQANAHNTLSHACLHTQT